MPSCWATRARVVDVGHRAAARVALAAPELHRDADDVVACLARAARRRPTSRRRRSWRRAPSRATSPRRRSWRRPAAGTTSRRRGRRRRRSTAQPSDSRSAPTAALARHAHRARARATAPSPRSRTTSAADAHTPVAVEQEQQRLGLDAVDADVRRSPRPCGRAARSRRGQATCGDEPVDEPVAQRADPIDHRLALVVRERQRGGHAPRCRRRSGCRCAGRAPGRRRATSGSSATSAAHDERADALRAAELVGADRRPGRRRRARRGDVEPRKRLHGVGVQHRAGRLLGARARRPRRAAGSCRPRC